METKTKKKASKAGRPVLDNPLKERVNIRLSVDEMEALKNLAANTNYSITYIVRQLIGLGINNVCKIVPAKKPNMTNEELKELFYYAEFFRKWGFTSHIKFERYKLELERDEIIKKLELDIKKLVDKKDKK